MNPVPRFELGWGERVLQVLQSQIWYSVCSVTALALALNPQVLLCGHCGQFLELMARGRAQVLPWFLGPRGNRSPRASSWSVFNRRGSSKLDKEHLLSVLDGFSGVAFWTSTVSQGESSRGTVLEGKCRGGLIHRLSESLDENPPCSQLHIYVMRMS